MNNRGVVRERRACLALVGCRQRAIRSALAPISVAGFRVTPAVASRIVHVDASPPLAGELKNQPQPLARAKFQWLTTIKLKTSRLSILTLPKPQQPSHHRSSSPSSTTPTLILAPSSRCNFHNSHMAISTPSPRTGLTVGKQRPCLLHPPPWPRP